ncbi:MAG: tRNA uridine-5-carboxymethylaminomethyl(34) synthesis GTPase MnmE [Rhodocyclaceae bacterium]|nr:tRNA uridine-5-carboxymethylaminomethyl(34) synthesis GTPase MnmE [Rhodocyclaceae bacterium]
MAKPRRPDVIAAIATAPGRGGIGVVRVSGPSLFVFAKALSGIAPTPRHAHFVRFRAADGGPIDEGLLLYFPSPSSFTGEDVIELQGHGGPVVMEMLLARCVELGARLAEPGEFTRRAFLNERLDLAQAEAVADLIEASSQAAARSALRSLSGQFSVELSIIREQLIELRMLVEATLDFPEEELEFLESAQVSARIDQIGRQIRGVLDRAQQGSMLRRGLTVVLVGRPNVGKSSLLNRLSHEDRAIVTEHAGTTRDALRETIHLQGIPLHVIDTAGLRDTDDAIERIGIERTWREISRADVIVWLLDAADDSNEHDDREFDPRLPDGTIRITVRNKIDLSGDPAGRSDEDGGIRIDLSARSGHGVALLEAELLRIAGWHAHGEDVILARERHIAALRDARDHIDVAGQQFHAPELIAEELRLAHDDLARITGAFTADDLLGEIFSRFCIGK